MDQRIVVITGGSSGIGLAIAKRFATEGCQVFNLDLQSPEENLSNIVTILCDMTDISEVEKALSQIQAFNSRVDVLICNAGIHFSGGVEQTDFDTYHRVLHTNISSCFYALKTFLPMMREQREGAVIVVGSDQSLISKPNSVIYGATKSAVTSMARSCALDYAQYGIRVNAVCPGSIDTPLLQKALASYSKRSGLSLEKVNEEEAAGQPLNRVGLPEEVAELVFFLADNARAGYITGALYPIDGGYTAR